MILEYETSEHQLDRFKERFNSFSPEDITSDDRLTIFRNLVKSELTDFNPKKSYAIKLGKFKVNKNSKYYIRIGNREYYRLIDNYFKDSTGNEFWLIVRNNLATTFMLRKDVQSQDVNYLKNRLNVDYVVFNVDKLNENYNTKTFIKKRLTETLLETLDKPYIAYHGSKVKFNNFSDEFVGGKEANDQEGPGVYFTTSKNNALSYGLNLYKVEISPKNPVSTNENEDAPLKQIEWLIKQAPNWKETAQNWDINPMIGYKLAAKDFIEYNNNPHQQFLQVWYDFYLYNPVSYVRNMVKLGYDSIIINDLNSLINGENNITHIIVLNLNIIKFLEYENYSDEYVEN